VAVVRGPWKTDPRGTAGPARLCCTAMSAGGLGLSELGRLLWGVLIMRRVGRVRGLGWGASRVRWVE
jgi:hypothetical protein